jgi:hypothetical protein
MTTTGLSRLEPLQSVPAGVVEVASYQAGPAAGPPVLLLHGFPYDIHSEEAIMDQEGLEWLDSFTLARRVWIEAKRRAVTAPPPAPMSPLSATPVAPSTPRGLQEADHARAFQAAWEAGWNAGRSAGWQEGWDLRSAVDVVIWYANSRVDL